jgi:hypothetical protein
MSVPFRVLVVLMLSVLTACASIPPVTLNYYLPRGDLQMGAAVALHCDSQGIHVGRAVTSTMTYSADYEARARPIRITDFRGNFSDVTAAFTFTEDGGWRASTQRRRVKVEKSSRASRNWRLR